MTANQLLYRHRILKHLYFAHALSCADLSYKINKSLPLTARLLNQLVAEGLVLETGFAPSTGGRRPIMYALRSDVQYIVAVALDQFVARIAIMDMKNSFVSPAEKLELPLPNNPDALAKLTEKINQVIAQSRLPRNQIVGIGMGMPGFVDVKKGINFSFLKVPGKSITEYIAEKTGLPVFIENDSSLIALAELRFGAARGRKNAMVVNIGWGIGLGMILNEELFRGHNGFAGEFSHIPLFLNGKLCSCGKLGCLETETSLLFMIEKAQEGIRAGELSILQTASWEHLEASSTNIFRAASGGDRFAVELLSKAGYNIGRGVAVLIHLLNPEVIILSGRGAAAGKIWQAPIQQALNEHCIPLLGANTSIEISTLGYEAELIGAAALVMENYERKSKGERKRNVRVSA